MPGRYYRELQSIHINCEAPHAYFIPFESEEKAALERESSAYFNSLNGEWDFRFFPSVEELPLEAPDFPYAVECTDKMPVPFCWQLKTGRGYDVPNYINQDYPYPVDPPYLPDIIPCGFYRTAKNIVKNDSKSYLISFDGVSSCFYLWVNGKFIGYSQVSHCTSEFDITGALRDGENLFEALVVKHCTGSYMEDQDFFRLSGIFRDVYILERDKERMTDIFIKPSVSDDFQSAEISVSPVFAGKIRWKLVSPGGKELKSGEAAGDFSISVENAVLWNPEAPRLYTLYIAAGSEHIAFPVGIKRAEIKNSVFLLNGKKVKIKGINRHDMTPETGYYVSETEMLEDLYCLKRASVNAIRTSHYPNDPRFTGLCDRLGFMVIDEADLESHGMGYNYGDWYWDYWAYLCDAPEWTESCVDRMRRLFERDKNRACVIMWSLGNESGCGNNHRLMAQYVRSRDSSAIIHYENARIDYQERLNKDFSDISDVESRMYAPLDYLKEYLADESLKKPFFYCEYVSAWSTGDIPAHWEGFEENDKYMGGCIWEFKDHAVNIGTKEAPAYRYGGDFGDKPNDGVCCLDGLVHPDRRPRPGYADMKQTYKPFAAKYENGVLSIKNKRFFSSLAEFSAYCTIERNGIVIAKTDLGALDLSPGEEMKTSPVIPEADGNLTLNLHIVLNKDEAYAKKGYEIGFEQFILQKAPAALSSPVKNSVNTRESRTEIVVSVGAVRYTFSKITGMLVSVFNGSELLAAPAEISVYKALLPVNSARSVFERARFNEAFTKCYSCKITESTDERAVIAVSFSIAAPALPPAVRSEMTYTVAPDGVLNIDIRSAVTERAPALPRFGLRLTLPGGYENVSYLGYGAHETYADRYICSRFSKFDTTADADFEHYVRPTECSAHYGTVFARITDNGGKGISFASRSERGISFSARHYTDRQLSETPHDDELRRDSRLYINLDYRIHAENTDRLPERRFDEKEFSFGISLLPSADGV